MIKFHLKTNGLSHLSRKTVFLCFATAIVLLAAAFYFIAVGLLPVRRQIRPDYHRPLDVVSTAEHYTYSVNTADYSMMLTGNRIVRRGVKFMGVRSNVINKNYLDQIAGSYRTKQKSLTFQASTGEWDLQVEKPIKLMGNVRIKLNNRVIEASKIAIIDLAKGFIEVDGGKKMAF
jgi:hypothetical protein